MYWPEMENGEDEIVALEFHFLKFHIVSGMRIKWFYVWCFLDSKVPGIVVQIIAYELHAKWSAYL